MFALRFDRRPVAVWVRVIIFWGLWLTKPQNLAGHTGSESKLRIWGSESVVNPERPFVTLIHSCQRQFYFYLALELLVLYIQCAIYLWPPPQLISTYQNATTPRCWFQRHQVAVTLAYAPKGLTTAVCVGADQLALATVSIRTQNVPRGRCFTNLL